MTPRPAGLARAVVSRSSQHSESLTGSYTDPRRQVWMQLLLLVALWISVAAAFPTNCTDNYGRVAGPCGPGLEQCGPKFGASAPQFHLRSASCAVNDPNGPMWDPVHGVYHIFWQERCAEPQGSQGVGPVWGHAASFDFAKWTRLPNALWNDESYDISAVYTGSATIVHGKPVLIYPGICRACINKTSGATGTALVAAVPANASDPLYEQWQKHGVLVNNTQRDPSTAWDDGGGRWRLTTYTGETYTAADSDFWTWKRDDASAFVFPSGECPSLFRLPRLTPGTSIQSSTVLPSHVHKCSHAGDWMQLGSLVNEGRVRWRPSGDQKPVDQGAFYASKDFECGRTGRRINWGWARGISAGDALTMPREVTYHPVLQQLQFSVLDEQQALRGTMLASIVNRQLAAGETLDLVAADGEQAEIDLSFGLPSSDTNLSLVVTLDGVAAAEVFIQYKSRPEVPPVPPRPPPPSQPPQALTHLAVLPCSPVATNQHFWFGAERNGTSLVCSDGDDCDLTRVSSVESPSSCSKMCVQSFGPDGVHTGCVGWTHHPQNASHFAQCVLKGVGSKQWRAMNSSAADMSGLMGWGHTHGWLFNAASRSDAPVSVESCNLESGAAVVAGGPVSDCGNASSWVLDRAGLLHHMASGLCVSVEATEDGSFASLQSCEQIRHSIRLVNNSLHVLSSVQRAETEADTETETEADTETEPTPGRCLGLVSAPMDAAALSGQRSSFRVSTPELAPSVASRGEAQREKDYRQPGSPFPADAWPVSVGVKNLLTDTTVSDLLLLLPADTSLRVQLFADHSFVVGSLPSISDSLSDSLTLTL